jgi:hypothetical protein
MSIDNALAILLAKIPSIAANAVPSTPSVEKSKPSKVCAKSEPKAIKAETPIYKAPVGFTPKITGEQFLKSIMRASSATRKETEISLIKEYVGWYYTHLDHTGQLNTAIAKAKVEYDKQRGVPNECKRVVVSVAGYSAAAEQNKIAAEGLIKRKLRAESFLLRIDNATSVGDIASACRSIDQHDAAERVLTLTNDEAKILAASMAVEVRREVRDYEQRLANMGM